MDKIFSSIGQLDLSMLIRAQLELEKPGFCFPKDCEVEEIVVEVEPDDIKENLVEEDQDSEDVVDHR